MPEETTTTPDVEVSTEGTADLEDQTDPNEVVEDDAQELSKDEREIAKVRRQSARRRVALREVSEENETLKRRLQELETGQPTTETQKQLQEAQKQNERLQRRVGVVSTVASESVKRGVPLEFVMDSIDDDELFDADDQLVRDLVAEAADTFDRIVRDCGYIKAATNAGATPAPTAPAQEATKTHAASDMETTGTTAPVSADTAMMTRLQDKWSAWQEAKKSGVRREISSAEAAFNAERFAVRKEEGGEKVYRTFCNSLKL